MSDYSEGFALLGYKADVVYSLFILYIRKADMVKFYPSAHLAQIDRVFSLLYLGLGVHYLK